MHIRTHSKYFICTLIFLILLSSFGSCAEKISRTDPQETSTPTLGEKTLPDESTGMIPTESGTAQNGSLGGTLSPDAKTVLSVQFLQTGKSDCILLTLGEYTVLIDTADKDDKERIEKALSEKNITTIHYLILTHFDNDHIGSAAHILQKFTVLHLLLPDYTRRSDNSTALQSAIASQNVSVQTVTEQITFTLGNMTFTVNPTHLYDSIKPVVIEKDDSSGDVEENNFSLIVALNYGKQNLLFLGDAEKERVEEFIALPAASTSYALIKLPHHGDYNGQLRKLLNQTTPLYCVSCVASSQTVDAKLTQTLAQADIWHFLTCNGIITLLTDGKQVRVTQNAA